MGTEFNDHFSKRANDYGRYRPSYPDKLFKYLSSISPTQDYAWDCATGNGQAAIGVAKYFKKVLATDASENQIKNAVQNDRIDYIVSAFDDIEVESHSVDLIVVAQALHWFDTDVFFSAAKRVLKKNGILAVWTYNLLNISAGIDPVIHDLYKNILGDYWPPERRLVEEKYKGINFPFNEINAPKFCMNEHWLLKHVLGYLNTWSAVVKYKEETGKDPVSKIESRLKAAWGDTDLAKNIEWPISLIVGAFG